MLNPNFLKLQKLLNKKNKAIIVLVKRTIFFRVYTGFAFAIYFFLLFLSIFGNITFHEIWFSTFLVCLGTIFFVRFLCYNIDSSMFLGTWLCFSGAIGILNYVFVFDVIGILTRLDQYFASEEGQYMGHKISSVQLVKKLVGIGKAISSDLTITSHAIAFENQKEDEFVKSELLKIAKVIEQKK